MEKYFSNCDEQWKTEYVKGLLAMDNKTLLDEYTSWSSGDDYDGLYTSSGQWQYDKVTEILYDKLVSIGFLSPNDITPQSPTNEADK